MVDVPFYFCILLYNFLQFFVIQIVFHIKFTSDFSVYSCRQQSQYFSQLLQDYMADL